LEHQERLFDVPIIVNQDSSLQFLMEYLSVGCNIKRAYLICKLTEYLSVVNQYNHYFANYNLPFWLQHQESLCQIIEYHSRFSFKFPL